MRGHGACFTVCLVLDARFRVDALFCRAIESTSNKNIQSKVKLMNKHGKRNRDQFSVS